jgi:hypothetical protein
VKLRFRFAHSSIPKEHGKDVQGEEFSDGSQPAQPGIAEQIASESWVAHAAHLEIYVAPSLGYISISDQNNGLDILRTAH